MGESKDKSGPGPAATDPAAPDPAAVDPAAADSAAADPAAADPAATVPAATVVLLRPVDGVPFEVFLLKRHHKSTFMANRYVYPGGKLDSDDRSVELGCHCRGFLGPEIAARMGLEDEVEARALHIAAVREAFEEAGAFFATEGNDEPIDFTREDERDRYGFYREQLQEGEVSFHQIVGWEDLCLRIDALVYFAHWVTPVIERKRYDTRFFLARAPERQELVHCDRETTDSIWLTPADAIKRYRAGEFELAPPTIVTLEALSQFFSIDEALEHFRQQPVPMILPVFQPTEEHPVTLLLPNDPDYPKPAEPAADDAAVSGPKSEAAAREQAAPKQAASEQAVSEQAVSERVASEQAGGDGPTRVVRIDDQWWAFDARKPRGQLH